MPRALEPGATFDVVLECDKEKPKETRPTFIFHALNGREWKKVATINDRLEKSDSGAERIELLFEAICTGLIGWRHMANPTNGEAIQFEAENLDLIIDNFEAWELLGAMLRNGRLSTDDKKKSESLA